MAKRIEFRAGPTFLKKEDGTLVNLADLSPEEHLRQARLCNDYAMAGIGYYRAGCEPKPKPKCAQPWQKGE